MSTSSTKRRGKKRNPKAPPAKSQKRVEPAPVVVETEMSHRAWTIATISIIAVGAVLRLYDLNLVPLHHDEGVNGNFLVRLVRDGVYHYDPANYHGPTLYYFSAIIPWTIRLFLGTPGQNTYGLTTVTIRLVPALFGIATIWLVLLLRPRLGTIGALCAAGMLAISPGAVYLSRYFIHETLFTFFTLAFVVACLKYYDEGHPVFLVLASVSLALLFATKETAFVSAAVLLIALITARIYLRFRETSKARALRKNEESIVWRRLLRQNGGEKFLVIWLAVAVAVFLVVNLFFYSSFFKNYPQGVYDALKTFQFWTKTGKEAHVHPPATYIRWLFLQESPLLGFGAVGAALIIWKPKNTFALFSALWAFGLIAAYSLISYKTPWLALNFIIPLSLIAGYSFQYVYSTNGSRAREVLIMIFLTVAVQGYQTVDLNFYNYDNDSEHYVYVYAHTRRGILNLVDDVDKLARKVNGGATGITIVSPDYWPLPWYFRDYSRVGYFARMTETNEPLIIASESQGAEMQQRFGLTYRQVPSGLNDAGSFPLRPGVNLLLYARREIPAQ